MVTIWSSSPRIQPSPCVEYEVVFRFAAFNLLASRMWAPEALGWTSRAHACKAYLWLSCGPPCTLALLECGPVTLQVGARSAGQYIQGLCGATAAVAGGQARCQLVDDSGGEEADEADGEEVLQPCPHMGLDVRVHALMPHGISACRVAWRSLPWAMVARLSSWLACWECRSHTSGSAGLLR